MAAVLVLAGLLAGCGRRDIEMPARGSGRDAPRPGPCVCIEVPLGGVGREGMPGLLRELGAA